MPAVIPHIVNNIGCWGRGFVLAITKRFGKSPESAYKTWFYEQSFSLGKIQIVKVSSNIHVINMVAQKGIISRDNPKPLDLISLDYCLKEVYKIAKTENVTVHMPRIGCGLAGGKWEEVEPLIRKHISVETYVYDFK